ncbi:neuropeptide FF receptor 2 [Otolemur garnettii]|uniref:Neuropeptide FF receptor 1 n=1 Tax=Otolemur garnettii TaxID=30611 RepID=H0XZX8_OTOGA|nr:neuropeptide FF receptor 2 [Otolemur garnettii]
MNEKWESNSSENWLPPWRVNDTSHPLSSDINITYVNYYLHQPPVAAIFISSYFLIFFLCIVGNTVVCFIVMRNKHMHTVTNLFILNLAISDLLVGIFCMPITLLDNIIAGWPFGSAMCKISGLVQGVSVAASVFTLVAIAVDRFRSVVYPFKSKLTLETACVVLGIIWVLAVAIMSPSAVMLHVQEAKLYRVRLDAHNGTGPVHWCREAWPRPAMRRVYTTVLLASVYLAPLLLIVALYGAMGVALSRPAPQAQARERRPAASRQKRRALKMLLVVALLFVLSWLPLWTLMMLSDYAELSPRALRLINVYVYPVAHWLAFGNSSVNPIVYGFFNANFRRGFRDAVRLRLCGRRARPREARPLGATGGVAAGAGRRNPRRDLLHGTSAETPSQDLEMEELREATNSGET